MWLKALRGIRLWNIFLFFVIIVTRSAFIGVRTREAYGLPNYNGISFYDDDLRDIWYTIALAVLFFLIYIYSLKGKPLVNKYLRALLMLGLAGILLYFNIDRVVGRIHGQARENQKFMNLYGQDPPVVPFDCSVERHFIFNLGIGISAVDPNAQDTMTYSKTSPSSECLLQWISVFLAMITAPFIVIEVLLALKTGPLNISGKQERYGRDGYQDEANIVIVRPDQPYQPQQQGFIPQDNSQQQHQHFSTINALPDLQYGYPQYPQSISNPGHKEEYLGHLVEPQGSQQQQ